MPEPFVGEIRLFASGRTPRGWVPCDGRSLLIAQNQALFALLGTTFGGDGKTTFGLPDLRGRVPVHAGQNMDWSVKRGEAGGDASVPVSQPQMPPHAHAVYASNGVVTEGLPRNNLWGDRGSDSYGTASASVAMNPGNVGPTGGGVPHENRQPFLVLQFAVAVDGIFPSRDGHGGSDPYIGEMRVVAFDFAPGGWALCDGQLLPITTNTALFSLLGVIYGGDGRSTFALPDLQARAPLHQGQGEGLTDRPIGSSGGTAQVTLAERHLPPHSHPVLANEGLADQADPADATWAPYRPSPRDPPQPGFSPPDDRVAMDAAALAPTGGGQPHNNLQPYLGLRFIIALEGEYPSRP